MTFILRDLEYINYKNIGRIKYKRKYFGRSFLGRIFYDLGVKVFGQAKDLGYFLVYQK